MAAELFNVGDYVAFQPEGDEDTLYGRVLVVVEFEFVVEVDGKIYWISKAEAMRP